MSQPVTTARNPEPTTDAHAPLVAHLGARALVLPPTTAQPLASGFQFTIPPGQSSSIGFSQTIVNGFVQGCLGPLAPNELSLSHPGVGVLQRTGRTPAGDQFQFTPDPNFEGKITLDIAGKRTIFDSKREAEQERKAEPPPTPEKRVAPPERPQVNPFESMEHTKFDRGDYSATFGINARPGAQISVSFNGTKGDGSPLEGVIQGPAGTANFNYSPGGVAVQRVLKPAGSEQLIVGAIRGFSGQMTITVDGQSKTVDIPPAAGSAAAPPAKTPQADSPPNPLGGLVRERLLSGFYSERMVVSARPGAEISVRMEGTRADGTAIDETVQGSQQTNNFVRSDGSVAIQRQRQQDGNDRLTVAPFTGFVGRMTITVDGQSRSLDILPGNKPAGEPSAAVPPQNPLRSAVRERFESRSYSERLRVDVAAGTAISVTMEGRRADGALVNETVQGFPTTDRFALSDGVVAVQRQRQPDGTDRLYVAPFKGFAGRMTVKLGEHTQSFDLVPETPPQVPVSRAAPHVDVGNFRIPNHMLPSPDQLGAASCLYMAATGIGEYLLNQARGVVNPQPGGPTDLSEQWTIYQGRRVALGNNFTDAVDLLLNGGYVRDENLKFLAYGSASWMHDPVPALPANYVHKDLPPYVKEVIVNAGGEGTQRVNGVMRPEQLEQIKSFLREHESPVLFVYQPPGAPWWHANIITGYDDKRQVFITRDSSFGAQRADLPAYNYDGNSPYGSRHYRGEYEMSYQSVLAWGNHATGYRLATSRVGSNIASNTPAGRAP